jgi:hypothetical protein
MQPMLRPVTIAAATLALVSTAGAAVTAAPGYAVRNYPTPVPVQGGVVRRGNAMLFGQGPTFSAGAQSVVRLDGTRLTTVATGFNSLGGFDLDGSGNLYVVDNCFGTDGCGSPTTGDTVYKIADATTRTTATTANASELVPSGTFSTPQDVLVVGSGVVLIADAVGVGAGRVVKLVEPSTVSNLVTGLDFLGGLATDGSTLFVGNLDGSFVGSVRKFVLATGASLGTLVGGLSGSYGLARDEAGNVLVTGGFTNDFSSSTVEAVNAAGTKTERARGFTFSSDIAFDPARGQALVLDFAATQVSAICKDANGDQVCDADVAGPAAVEKPKLKLTRQLTPPGDDTLSMKGEMTIPTSPALDPVANGATVIVDDADGRVIVDVVVPGGAYDPVLRVGWKARGTIPSWTYKNRDGLLGITSIKLKRTASAPNLVKFAVKGKRGDFSSIGAALPVRGVVALGPAGQGGLLTFDGPARACTALGGGSTLNCK